MAKLSSIQIEVKNQHPNFRGAGFKYSLERFIADLSETYILTEEDWQTIRKIISNCHTETLKHSRALASLNTLGDENLVLVEYSYTPDS